MGSLLERVDVADPRIGAIAADELMRRMLGIPEAVSAPLIAMQVRSKLGSIRDQFPHAVVDLLSHDREPAGYAIFAESDGLVRLCDIAVVGSARGRGFGSILLAGLLDAADVNGASVSLSVWHDAAARSWYERHGFASIGGDHAGYLEMRRDPRTPEGR